MYKCLIPFNACKMFDFKNLATSPIMKIVLKIQMYETGVAPLLLNSKKEVPSGGRFLCFYSSHGTLEWSAAEYLRG